MKHSIRANIMALLKTHFFGLSIWKEYEADIAILCSGLPEPVNKERKKALILGLSQIHDFLIEKGVDKDDLGFLDNEIEVYRKTKQISLYAESEDRVSKDVIDRYANLSMGAEGIMGIHLPLNYAQLAHLTNAVYERTELIKFYISRERTIYGKIVAEIYEYPQKIPVATLLQSKKKDKDTGEPARKEIALFGESLPYPSIKKLKEITAPFYVYRFITRNNKEMILLTTEREEIGDYIITGVLMYRTDNRQLTDSAKLPTKLPFFFAQETKNRIIRYKNHHEFIERAKYLEIDKRFFDYPFTIVKGPTTYLARHPKWFKWLIWAWLVHEKKGLFNNYPLHIMEIGPHHSGKSLLLNGLHAKSRETIDVFSGSSSTMKDLVPSFKYKPAKLGYLAESNRFAYCDEFLRCIMNMRTAGDSGLRNEAVGIMNDLLEHQKRRAGSGISSVNVNMTARILATSNPARGIHTVEDLLRTLSHSFLSRWLIYYQDVKDLQVEMARHSKDTELKTEAFNMRSKDWVSLLDYFHSFSAVYDMNKVEEIHKLVPKVLSEDLKKHYDARHTHHIECLIDGIVKARCLFEHDESFIAKPEDYEVLKEVWLHVIRSWIRPDYLKKLETKDKIFYLPENCQWIYWRVNERKKALPHEEVESIALEEMKKKDYTAALAILLDTGVLREIGGSIRPYWMTDDYDGTQERLQG